MKEITKLVIDADSIVWKVGSACENTEYNYLGKVYAFKSQAVAACKKAKGDVEDIQLQTNPEPEDSVRKTVTRYIDDMVLPFKVFDYKLYLGTPGNFRHKVATRLPYKGTRKQALPTHFPFIRSVMRENYDCVLASPTLETDDMIAMLDTEEEDLLIASIDKDLLQIPGQHHNYDNGKYTETTQFEGIKYVAKQMLTGDVSDNILGLCGVGAKSSYIQKITKAVDVAEVFFIVTNLYQKHYGTYAFQFLRENFMLLRLVREVPTPYESYFMDRLNIVGRYWE